MPDYDKLWIVAVVFFCLGALWSHFAPWPNHLSSAQKRNKNEMLRKLYGGRR